MHLHHLPTLNSPELHLVGLKHMGPLSREIPQIDLRSVWSILRLRWWIIPICMIVALGLMFAQESDLQTTPNSIQIIKTYGARDELAGLALFGVDPNSVKEFPSFQNQLAIVRTDAPAKIDESLAQAISIGVSRTDPQVSLINSAANDGGQKFTVLSAGTPNYVFTCISAERSNCDKAIDIYVGVVTETRKAGIIDGLKRLSLDVSRVLATTSAGSADLSIKLNAINASIATVSGELSLVGEDTQTTGGTVSSVKLSTYVFGLSVGLLVAILIILQLTYTDNKIRSRRSLNRLQSELLFLGELQAGGSDSSATQVASALVFQAKNAEAASVHVCSTDSTSTSAIVAEALEKAGIAAHLTVVGAQNVDSMSVNELVAQGSQAFVLIAWKHSTKASDLMNAQQTLVGSGNRVLGVILATPAN